MAVLNAALDSHPLAARLRLTASLHFGPAISRNNGGQSETLYGDVELVELPDRIFGASVIESALLIAREPRPPAPAVLTLRSTEVSDRDRVAFLKTGKTTTERHVVRAVGSPPSGELWVPPLQAVWDYLQMAPRLERHFTIHRGIEWKTAQDSALEHARPRRLQERATYCTGRATVPYCRTSYGLDCRPDRLLYKAIDLPWERPKLIANAGRLSRGPWRDRGDARQGGLAVLAAIFGLWPCQSVSDVELLTFAAVLNGPVSNAFSRGSFPG